MTDKYNQPIYWHQGLFLQPHHLQYQDLKSRYEIYKTMHLLSPWLWGVESVNVRLAALDNEQLSFDGLSILWPDGTLTDISSNAIIDSMKLKVGNLSSGGKIVYVGLRRLLRNQQNVGVYESMPEAVNANYRHVITADPQAIPEFYSGEDEGQASLMSYVLKLFWEDEINELSSYELMPLVKLELDGEKIIVNKDFIAPSLTLNAAPNLLSQLSNLIEGLTGRARQLEIFKRPMHTISRGTNSEQVYSVLALSVLNRFASELSVMYQNAFTTPMTLHSTLKNLIAELSTFSEYCNFTGETRDGKNLNGNYLHNDLFASFTGLFSVVSHLLNDITLGPEMMIRFKRSIENQDMYTVDLPMNFFGANHDYYLIFRNSEFSEDFIQKIEREAKLDETGVIEELVRKYLPGLPVKYLSELPSGLPRQSGSEYFVVLTDEKEWNSIIRRRDISLFIPDAPNELNIDLIVVKRS